MGIFSHCQNDAFKDQIVCAELHFVEELLLSLPLS